MTRTRRATVRIRKAGPESVGSALQILRGASAWLASRGLEGWSGEDLQRREFLRHARRGELVLAFLGDRPAACMLLQRVDALYWPRAARGSALYLHKLAAAHIGSGADWSGRMIEWAKKQARREGISRLRLDTPARSPLVRVYARHGFRRVDRAPRLIQGRVMWRMECRVPRAPARVGAPRRSSSAR